MDIFMFIKLQVSGFSPIEEVVVWVASESKK